MGALVSLHQALSIFQSQEDYSVLLLGTSLQIKDSYHGHVRVASRRSRDHQASKADGNLEGILLDLENMRKKLLSPDVEEQQRFRNRCDIYNVWNQQRRQGKKEMLEAITDFFGQVKRNFILYYSGHGEANSGNWVIGKPDVREVEVVSLDELLSLWRKSPSSDYKRLLIISDSCHSGAWVDKLEKMHKSNVNCNISMIASCQADESCTDTRMGGDFTRYMLREQPDDYRLGFNPNNTSDLSEADAVSQYQRDCTIQ